MKYEIEVDRTTTRTSWFNVEADTEDKAVSLAYEKAADHDYSQHAEGVAEYEVVNIKQEDPYQDWVKKYQPIMDPDNPDKPKDFGYTGEEVAMAIRQGCLWSLCTEGDDYWISSGARWVNRMEYWICKIPYHGDTLTITY